MNKTIALTLGTFMCIVSGNKLFSQANENFFKLNVNAAIIANKAFSQVTQPDNSGHSPGHTEINQLGKHTIIKPGCAIGIEAEVGDSDVWKYLTGVSMSFTQNEYKYYEVSYVGNNYEGIKTTDFNVHEQIFYLNIHFGTKRKLYKNLYMKNELLIQRYTGGFSHVAGNAVTKANTLYAGNNYPGSTQEISNAHIRFLRSILSEIFRRGFL